MFVVEKVMLVNGWRKCRCFNGQEWMFLNSWCCTLGVVVVFENKENPFIMFVICVVKMILQSVI